ncbi:hypothetical protein CHS0354_008671 [Potamilus streckersoni]|uniref:Uncharacterized protein n=1 Tax=Potamilus streckersoni TaxID=2493646 RepID=A0AAE0TIS1_9BIVA|nr:hypothetical protein CHS0354_008671 [Potamilus streckersoni]
MAMHTDFVWTTGCRNFGANQVPLFGIIQINHHVWSICMVYRLFYSKSYHYTVLFNYRDSSVFVRVILHCAYLDTSICGISPITLKTLYLYCRVYNTSENWVVGYAVI